MTDTPYVLVALEPSPYRLQDMKEAANYALKLQGEGWHISSVEGYRNMVTGTYLYSISLRTNNKQDAGKERPANYLVTKEQDTFVAQKVERYRYRFEAERG